MSNLAAEVAEKALELGMLAPARSRLHRRRTRWRRTPRLSSALLLLRIQSPKCSRRRSSLACPSATPGPSLLLLPRRRHEPLHPLLCDCTALGKSLSPTRPPDASFVDEERKNNPPTGDKMGADVLHTISSFPGSLLAQ